MVTAWLTGAIAPHSERLHVEESVLLVDRDVTLGLRMSARSVLVRLDLPDGATPVRETVERVLGAQGLELLDNDNQLALAVAIQMVALRMSSWDLWGADIDVAFADLRSAAVGDQGGLAGL
ncbi:MAG: hypothetical protein ACRD0Q_09710 [Acidimicrobiales bacterium]